MPLPDRPRPRASADFYLGHGLGNDYLVVEEAAGGWTMEPAAVAAVCRRHEGVGSDGIAVVLAGGSPAFRVRIFNPDGGEVERSGNGLRVVASHLLRVGRVGVGEAFRVRVGGDELAMTVHGRGPGGRYDVSVEMGRAETGADAVAGDTGRLAAPATGPADPSDASGSAGGAHAELDHPAVGPLPLHLVSVGNPHAVVFADAAPAGAGLRMDRASLERVGPGLTAHPAFRNGINVQLARVVAGGDGGSPPAVEALIWERGVGPTTASGTSACAVAVAAVESGRVPAGPVEVRMEGGMLAVTVGADLDVVLRGPVQEVCIGALAPGFLAGLGTGPDGEDGREG